MATTIAQNEPQLSGKLTNAQLELMKLFSLKLTSSEMARLKETMVSFLNSTMQERIKKKIAAGELSLREIDRDRHLRIKK